MFVFVLRCSGSLILGGATCGRSLTSLGNTIFTPAFGIGWMGILMGGWMGGGSRGGGFGSLHWG